MNLILASGSAFRKDLLSRLRLSFTCVTPDIEEKIHPGESHEDMVLRLAQEKAYFGAKLDKEAVSIGSDTVASFEGEILGKPLNHKTAIQQLKKMRGKTVTFLTGVCVYSAPMDVSLCAMVPSVAHFRDLSNEMIEKYLELEKPYYSSGSFKSETTGCALIHSLESEDPSAIIGLPLIKLCELLEKVGVKILG